MYEGTFVWPYIPNYTIFEGFEDQSFDWSFVVTGLPGVPAVEPGQIGTPPGPVPEYITYEINIDPYPPEFMVTTEGASVQTTADNFIGVIPVYINYLMTRYDDSEFRVRGWTSVPDEATEIVEMDVTGEKVFDMIVSFTAHSGAISETVSYVWRIKSNNDRHQITLKEEIEKRKPVDFTTLTGDE